MILGRTLRNDIYRRTQVGKSLSITRSCSYRSFLVSPWGCRYYSNTAENSPIKKNVQNETKQQNVTNQIKFMEYYIFGSCEHGQLGLGEMKQSVLSPKKIDFLDSLDVAKLVIGQNHTIVILKNGAAMSWGFNQTGQLGQGHRDPCCEPQPIVGLDGHKVVDAACGPLQSFLITENLRTGKQAIWHVGTPYWDESPTNRFTTYTALPRKLQKKNYLGSKKIKKILPAEEFAVFISEDNCLYTFGNSGTSSFLGHGVEPDIKLAGPTLLPSLEKIPIVSAEVGWGHTLALTVDHKVYAWGSNSHGQCGVDSGSDAITAPRLIKFFENIDIVQIACGLTHSLARDKDGNVYTWGSHAEGKLGIDNLESDLLAPRKVDFFDGKNIVHVACGTDHSAALSDSGSVYLWGFGQHGALSILTEFQNAWTPVKLPEAKFSEKTEKTEKKKKIQSKKGNYPYLDEQMATLEGEFFETFFHHKAVNIQCGMDLTVLTMEVKKKEEL